MKKRKQEGAGGVWSGSFDYFWTGNLDIMLRLVFGREWLIMRSMFSVPKDVISP